MKHIKLFEAFESKILSRTLGFIQNKSDKDKFLQILKKVCTGIDFPFSKLSDHQFEYLPFGRALEKADMTGDEPCEATSEKEFPEHAVPGAKCEGGRIERKWGSRTRKVECPVCYGTGLKTKSPRLKLLKFWFTKEGKLVATTAVDGLAKPNRGSVKSGVLTSSENFTDMDKYKISKENLSLSEVQNLPNGSIVLLKNEKGEGLAYCYQSRRDGRTYLLQNFANGATPDDSGWQSIARWSWAVVSNGDFYKIDLLEALADDDKKEEEEIDPYTWNLQVDTRRNITLIDRSIEDLVKPAHFAIILDLGKLGKSNFKPASEISSERLTSRKDAVALMKGEDIKKANIERYLQIISSRANLTEDITRVDKVAKKIVGGRLVLFFIISSSMVESNLSEIVTEYLRYLRAVKSGSSETDLEIRSEYLTKTIRKSYKEVSDKGRNISKNLDFVKSKLTEEGRGDLLEIVEKLERISSEIWNNLSEIKLETIEDLEVFIQKVKSVDDIFNTRRWSLQNLTSFLRYADVENHSEFHRRAYYITDRIEEINIDLDRLSKVIKKIV